MEVKRALVSVSDKTGIVEFAQALTRRGVTIISTGGTAALLAQNKIPVTPVSEVTGFPEILDGRVKTLHPKIHGGILARRGDPKHVSELAKNDIAPIDMVVINLYPFSQTIARSSVTVEEAIEQIDIGGPSMLRAAAKNFEHVAAVVDRMDYDLILKQLEETKGVNLATRLYLAEKVFAHTAAYDAAVADYMSHLVSPDGKTIKESTAPHALPARALLALEKVQDLRYGENPHQRAALYRSQISDFRLQIETDASSSQICNLQSAIYNPLGGLVAAEVFQGKELSFNNFLDLNAAWDLVWEFEDPVAVIIKHNNPCGVATGDTPADAYVKAYATDPVSAFGSVLGFNRTVDEALVTEITRSFVEAILAPDYTSGALELLKAKKNLRVLKCDPATSGQKAAFDIRSIGGGFLVQDKDVYFITKNQLRVVTRRKPSEDEVRSLLFAWRVAKHVKSNAIVYAFPDRTAGIGAGQMSRVDSVKLAAMKAQVSLQGSVVASDAFFPFRDGLDEAAKAGATAVIQPGGSIRDEEVIRAADEHGMAMVFTGIRHFRH
jgi:phosphoribosylaminoimidazolecarboxamide formyltransferase/IMP cyclohydrolase